MSEDQSIITKLQEANYKSRFDFIINAWIKNMVVFIELFGIQRDIAKVNKIKMSITNKTIVRDALEYLRSSYPALPLDKDSFLITVNHELAPPERLLKANDIICILPHIGGG